MGPPPAAPRARASFLDPLPPSLRRDSQPRSQSRPRGAGRDPSRPRPTFHPRELRSEPSRLRQHGGHPIKIRESFSKIGDRTSFKNPPPRATRSKEAGQKASKSHSVVPSPTGLCHSSNAASSRSAAASISFISSASGEGSASALKRRASRISKGFIGGRVERRCQRGQPRSRRGTEDHGWAGEDANDPLEGQVVDPSLFGELPRKTIAKGLSPLQRPTGQGPGACIRAADRGQRSSAVWAAAAMPTTGRRRRCRPTSLKSPRTERGRRARGAMGIFGRFASAGRTLRRVLVARSKTHAWLESPAPSHPRMPDEILAPDVAAHDQPMWHVPRSSGSLPRWSAR